VHFEVPAVLQSSHQWSYDPNSGQKPPELILANLILLVAKGGNYLLNVAPGPSGVWPPSAIAVLKRLAAWMAVNGEAIQDTAPSYPFQFEGVYITSRDKVVYAMIPRVQPSDGATNPTWQALHTPSAVPTLGNMRGDGTRDDVGALLGMTNLTLPWLRTELLKDQITGVELLGQGPCKYTLVSGEGLVVAYTPAPIPLRSYWSPLLNDTAPCGLRDGGTCITYTASHDQYTLKRVEALCLPAAAAGTVPVDLRFSGALQDNALSSPTWCPPVNCSGYAALPTECYLFTDAAAGLVPVDAYWSAAREVLSWWWWWQFTAVRTC